MEGKCHGFLSAGEYCINQVRYMRKILSFLSSACTKKAIREAREATAAEQENGNKLISVISKIFLVPFWSSYKPLLCKYNVAKKLVNVMSYRLKSLF